MVVGSQASAGGKPRLYESRCDEQVAFGNRELNSGDIFAWNHEASPVGPVGWGGGPRLERSAPSMRRPVAETLTHLEMAGMRHREGMSHRIARSS
jgi:hypothetical protein